MPLGIACYHIQGIRSYECGAHPVPSYISNSHRPFSRNPLICSDDILSRSLWPSGKLPNEIFGSQSLKLNPPIMPGLSLSKISTTFENLLHKSLSICICSAVTVTPKEHVALILGFPEKSIFIASKG